MAGQTRQALAQLQLHLSPSPRNIAESRIILRALRKFGEIQMFKVLRFEETTKELTPKAHIIFKSQRSANDLMAASPFLVPDTNITVTPSQSIFNHPQYIGYVSAQHYIKSRTLLSRRRSSVIENHEVEIPDLSTRIGSDGSLEPSTQLREMRSRLLVRYSGGFLCFKDLEMRIAWEAERKQQLRDENEKLARGEEVDLSAKSDEELHSEQLGTIQDILGDLGAEGSKIAKENQSAQGNQSAQDNRSTEEIKEKPKE